MLQTTLSDNSAIKQEFTNKNKTEKSWKLKKKSNLLSNSKERGVIQTEITEF